MKPHGSSSHVSVVQAVAGVMVFCWHTLGIFVPIEDCLNAKADLSTVADHVHSFMTSVDHLPMNTSSSITHVTKLKSSQTSFLIVMSSVKSNAHQI